MPSAAEEHRRRLVAARAAEIKTRRYKPPAKRPKSNRVFTKKGGGRDGG